MTEISVNTNKSYHTVRSPFGLECCWGESIQ